MEETDFPSAGETVVIKIVNVLDYGVFAELLEYDNLKGFVHISQVSSGWIKNIRNYVKEGQIRAAKVQAVDRQKNQIDLSLTKVSGAAQRAKINEYKQLKRERKLIENLAKRQKKSFEEAWDYVAEPLLKKYGSLVDAFKEIAIYGDSAADGVEKSWLKPLVEMVGKSVTVPEKTVKGTLEIKVLAPNGVEIIRDALSKGVESTKDAEIEIYYMGSGKYMVRSMSHDFKVAERAIEFSANNVIGAVKAGGGEANFERAN